MTIKTMRLKIVRSGAERRNDKGRLWCHGCQEFLDPSSFAKSTWFMFNKNTNCVKCASVISTRANDRRGRNRRGVSNLHGKIRMVGEDRRNKDGLLWCFKCQNHHHPSEFGVNNRNPLGITSSCRIANNRDRASRMSRYSSKKVVKPESTEILSDEHLVAAVRRRVLELTREAVELEGRLIVIGQRRTAFADALLGK